jgi:hypothetical protein
MATAAGMRLDHLLCAAAFLAGPLANRNAPAVGRDFPGQQALVHFSFAINADLDAERSTAIFIDAQMKQDWRGEEFS